MMDSLLTWIEQFSPVQSALIATLFTWLVTAAGASLVFLFKEMKRSTLWHAWFYRWGDGGCEFLVALGTGH